MYICDKFLWYIWMKNIFKIIKHEKVGFNSNPESFWTARFHVQKTHTSLILSIDTNWVQRMLKPGMIYCAFTDHEFRTRDARLYIYKREFRTRDDLLCIYRPRIQHGMMWCQIKSWIWFKHSMMWCQIKNGVCGFYPQGIPEAWKN